MSDLRRLVHNTLYSGFAFLAVGSIAILLVPILIRAFGVAGLGAIFLGRALLPTGVMAVLDLGLAESATQAISRARADGDWRRCGEQVSLLVVVSVIVGTVVGALVVAAAPLLVALFRIDAALQAGFEQMMRVTGVAFAMLFPGLVVEGLVKGFERFGVLRAWEVATAVGYGAVTIVLVAGGAGFETVHYAFLAALACRYVALLAWVIPVARAAGLRPMRCSRPNRAWVWARSRLFLQSKIVGAMQGQSPPLFIGAFVGPAGVGIYELLTRLPRFLKPVLSIMASALMPLAGRLEGMGDAQRMRAIGKACFWLVPLAAFGPLLMLMVLAQSILILWVGESFARYWPWLVCAMLVPLLLVVTQFGLTALQVRPEALRKTNRISGWCVLIQLALSFALIAPLGELAFILGQTVAAALALPLYLRLLGREFELGSDAGLWLLARFVVPALVLAPLLLLLPPPTTPHGILAVVVGFAVACAAYWLTCYRLLLSSEQRDLLRRILALAGSVRGAVRSPTD